MSGAKKYFFEKIENLQTLDLIYFHGMTFFDDDGSKYYLVFQSLIK